MNSKCSMSNLNSFLQSNAVNSIDCFSLFLIVERNPKKYLLISQFWKLTFSHILNYRSPLLITFKQIKHILFLQDSHLPLLLHTTCWCISSTICSFIISLFISCQTDGEPKYFLLTIWNTFLLGQFYSLCK